ncbi:carboxylesterase family protein [Arthrobacter sp. BE255]|uniref:carboxylesterase/lipase family protein n=1 Tax=Arthrobacter sp. BE255 TaxID=2817721 RepID=UPI00285D8135|nr:carboxylesterase family protein [Arthrobacter sp. BE255]MDR7158103.1 para-nitrobenzyl esterase [Arthrobacter sp. BE255]
MSTVSTPQGTVRGTALKIDGRTAHAFLGVPYAESPRFRPPVPVTPWDGVRDCTAPGAMAPQNPDPFTPPSDTFADLWDEDSCLNLNIWTPAPDGARRPVMVWIHGGAYVGGSNNGAMHDGGPLASAADVVVVAVNYRLGAFGFLHLPELLGPEYADSSNVALLDLLEALRWVSRNIAAFGGDPGNVTVFGESAGAAAIGTMLGMPASEGLFRRAIMQSGTAERYRTADESAAVAAEFLRLCGLDAARAGELLALPAGRLLAAQKALAEAEAGRSFSVPLPFQPTVGTPSLPEPPLDAVRNGRNSAVDLMAGTNLNEGSFAVEMRPAYPSDPPRLEDRVELLLAACFADPAAAREHYADALADALGAQPGGKQLLEACLADQLYRQPSNRLLDARASSSGTNFSYLFTWPSPALDGKLGACHALEIPFVFRQLDCREARFLVGTEAPAELSAMMGAAWSAFARAGEPAAAGLPRWPSYAAQSRETMVLDIQPRIEADPRSALRTFWAAQPDVAMVRPA